jgi:hypothetical protein
MSKKKYTKEDYDYVLNKILESWSDSTMPNSKKILHDLKTKKKLMDEEYDFYKEMDS